MKKKIPFDLERAKAGEPFYFDADKYPRRYIGVDSKGKHHYEIIGGGIMNLFFNYPIDYFNNAYHLIKQPERWVVVDKKARIYTSEKEANDYTYYNCKAVRLHDENIEG
jgi:hypothetical protein